MSGYSWTCKRTHTLRNPFWRFQFQFQFSFSFYVYFVVSIHPSNFINALNRPSLSDGSCTSHSRFIFIHTEHDNNNNSNNYAFDSTTATTQYNNSSSSRSSTHFRFHCETRNVMVLVVLVLLMVVDVDNDRSSRQRISGWMNEWIIVWMKCSSHSYSWRLFMHTHVHKSTRYF